MIELTSCTIDLTTGALSGDREGRLTERERLLLVYLAARPGKVIPRDELLSCVWGYSDQVNSRAVDNTVRRLREKIEVDPGQPQHLLTAFGTGYRFEPLRQAPEAPVGVPRELPRRRCVVLGDRTVDLDLGELRIAQAGMAPAVTPLTTGEVGVLAYLAERSGRVVDQQELARAVGKRAGRALHNTIYRLRAKLEPDPDEPRYLLTAKGSGYRLVVPAPAPRRTPFTLVRVGLTDEDLWASDPAEAGAKAAALAQRLEKIAREAGGLATGDLRFAFEDAGRALSFAAGLPREETALSAAVHRGQPVIWVDPVSGRASCLGPEVYRVDDLCRRAPPGAVLVDEDLWEAIGAASGLQARRTGHGAVALGEGPELEASPGDAPAPAALPWVGDRFLGRAREQAALRQALAEGSRLVTLTGPAGVGKSRLALEVLSEMRPAGGVFHVPLGGARTVDAMLGAVASALRVQAGKGELAGQLTNVLARGEPRILWLDDCDAVGPAVLPLLGRWLAAAPQLTLLATSRRALQIEAELVLELDPLPEEDATALFLDRATPGQGPTSPEDEAAMIALVRELDGLPLALELAAARTAVLPAQKMLERLSDAQRAHGERLKLLARSGGERLERHRSVRAALDVSWELLDAHERRALCWLSVFRGGFSLAAAETVLDSDAADAPWALDVLEALVRHHLVRVEGARYALLDSVAAYAAERLAEDPAAQRQAELAHGRAYASLGSRAEIDALTGPGAREARRRLVTESQNLEIALVRAHARGDASVAAGAALALAELRMLRGPFSDGVAQIELALSLPDPPRKAELLTARGRLRYQSGDPEGSEADLLAAVAAAQAEGDLAVEAHAEVRLDGPLSKRASPEVRSAHALRALTLARQTAGALASRVELMALLDLASAKGGEEQRLAEEEILPLARRLGDEDLVAETLMALGISERMRGRDERACELLESALSLFRALGDRRGEAMTLGNLANSLRHIDPAMCEAYQRASLAVHRQNGSLQGEAICLANLAATHYDAGKFELARGEMQEAVDLAAQIDATDYESLFRSNLGAMLMALGRAQEAGEQLRRSLQLAEALGNADRIATAAFALACLPGLESDEILRLLERAEAGLKHQPEHQLHVAARRGLVLLKRGDRDGALQCAAIAQRLRAELSSAYPENGPVLKELQDLLRKLDREESQEPALSGAPGKVAS